MSRLRRQADQAFRASQARTIQRSLEITPAGQGRDRRRWHRHARCPTHDCGRFTARTRAKQRSVWVDFFEFGARERGLPGNPARALAIPKKHDVPIETSRNRAPAFTPRSEANAAPSRPRRHSVDGAIRPARYGRPRPSPPRNAGGRELRVPTHNRDLQGKWRRRESNPRKRPIDSPAAPTGKVTVDENPAPTSLKPSR